MLLARYGILFRDLLTRESNAPKWRDLTPILRRLEARGEIRGGRFVTGVSGEQYALPEAADSLRAQDPRIRRSRPSRSPPPTPPTSSASSFPVTASLRVPDAASRSATAKPRNHPHPCRPETFRTHPYRGPATHILLPVILTLSLPGGRTPVSRFELR